MLTVGSLFAGIGGFDLGLERAGMRSVWQCEIDPYAQRVLEKHWPDVLRVPDIRGVGAGTVPYVDVICGGFPCQDLSYAGAGAGLDGARSGLWSEYARVVGELRPRYVVVENVSALLARGLGRVLGDLAALGYDAEWDCIPASAVGAPHRRDRIWLVAYPARDLRSGTSPAGTERERARAGGQPRDVGHAYGPGLEGHRGHDERPDERTAGPAGARAGAVADSGGIGCERRPRVQGARRQTAERHETLDNAGDDGGEAWGAWWLAEPDVGRVAHGVPARVDRLRALGNALVPQIAEWIGRRILEHEGAE